MNTNERLPVPLPRIARFESLGYGLFLHWGLYSQLGRGEWVQDLERIPVSDYARLLNTFTASKFDARAICRTARASGMRYAALTTRHHEGFSLYDTRGLDPFDAPHSPAGRDLVAEFADGCRAEGIVPFFYHTTLDWRWDTAHCGTAKFDEYLEYLHASVEILCRNYGEIGGLWFDGNWSRPDADWKEDRLYAMIRRHQPEAMIINNSGTGARGVTGHPETDSTTFEQGLPAMPDRRGWPKYLAGEMCQTLNTHWGISPRDFAYLSPREAIENLCACRKVGANYLLNIGPTAEGALPAYESAVLRKVGEWIEASGAARVLYEGRPLSGSVGYGRDFALQTGEAIYYFAHDLLRMGSEHVVVGSGGRIGPRAISGVERPLQSARWLDAPETGLALAQNVEAGLATLDCTGYPYGTDMVVRVAELR
jgi:alpha-L-fucosidase